MTNSQENLSRPGIIDARARYRVAARRVKNTELTYRTFYIWVPKCGRVCVLKPAIPNNIYFCTLSSECLITRVGFAVGLTKRKLLGPSLTWASLSKAVGGHSSATLTEVLTCFFPLICKANARVKPAKTGHGPHCSQLAIIFTRLFHR